MILKSTSTKKELPGGVMWKNVKGQLHREDGPAIEYNNGDKSWWVNGKYHRLDGPAREWSKGDKSWWVNDVQIKIY